MESDAHVWLARNWISPVLPSDTQLFCVFNHVRLLHSSVLHHHSSICLEPPLPTSSTCFLRDHSNVTYCVKNSLIPQRIQGSLLVFPTVPCSDLPSLHKYLTIS